MLPPMKLLLRAGLGVWLLVCPVGASAANYIYKGIYTRYNAVTGKSSLQPVFIILGDTKVVSSDAFTETFTTVTFDGTRGRKKFGSGVDITVQDFKQFVGAKLAEVYSAFTSGSNDHQSLVLRGWVRGTKYDAPMVLTGQQWYVYEDPASHFYAAEKDTYTVHLDRALTDASQAAGETQSDALQRVKDYLTNVHHYTE